MTLTIVLCAALLALAYALERRFSPTVDCWRCAGVGRVQRWHRITWKDCPRCGGTGERRRRGIG